MLSRKTANITLFITLIIVGIFWVLFKERIFALFDSIPLNLSEPEVFAFPEEGALVGISLFDQDIYEFIKAKDDTGINFSIVGVYQAWNGESNMFNFTWARSVSRNGAIPLITWEPWTPIGGFNRSRTDLDQEEFRLSNIANGVHDDYIQRYARNVTAYKNSIIIRFAHEMNGNWYPWGSTFNSPEEYISAWRHVQDLFAEVGATNVLWLWSPNENFTDPAAPYSDNFHVYYPGDEYVDIVGFSAFNWAGTYRNNVWKDPDELFDDDVEDLKIYNKPLIISETASADDENPERKANWIVDFDEYLRENPEIKAFVWFNVNDNGVDWRIDSTDASKRSFTRVFQDTYYD